MNQIFNSKNFCLFVIEHYKLSTPEGLHPLDWNTYLRDLHGTIDFKIVCSLLRQDSQRSDRLPQGTDKWGGSIEFSVDNKIYLDNSKNQGLIFKDNSEWYDLKEGGLMRNNGKIWRDNEDDSGYIFKKKEELEIKAMIAANLLEIMLPQNFEDTWDGKNELEF